MPNLFDYLAWRGDLPLERDPFNDVDALILSRLSFLPCDDLVSSGFHEPVLLREAALSLLAKEDRWDTVQMKDDLRLAEALAASGRFSSMRLCGFVNRVDTVEEKQFCALAIETGEPQGTDAARWFVSFRGTDNNLVGWKEDLNMSFLPWVPSQKEAADYLYDFSTALPGPFRIGGHSKGGNLAVYAAAFSPRDVQKRIVRIYNNDGPGFHAEIIATPGYARVRDRVRTFVPQSSVVGMMLEHEEEYVVIHSTQSGLFQHDIYSWEVMGPDFVRLDTVDSDSRFVDGTLKTWLADMSPEERGRFIDALYSVIAATGARTVPELTSKWYAHAAVAVKTLFSMDDSMREAIAYALRALLSAGRKNWGKFD